jgi:ABC-type transporter Mla maintaining outer membrane lipid asymmetry ATPase subunit MlaF
MTASTLALRSTIIGYLLVVQEFTLLSARTIRNLFKPPFYVRETILQMDRIGVLSEHELPRVRQRMAMIFQGATLFDSLTVRENVGYRLWEQRRLPDDAIEQVGRQSLQFVSLEDTVDKMPADLSSGMRKRVGIACALASGAGISPL